MDETLRTTTGAGIAVAECDARTCIDLRGDPQNPKFLEATRRTLDLVLPRAACTSAVGLLASALWLGPDQWLIVSATQEAASLGASLRSALRTVASAVTDVSRARIVYAFRGVHARDLLAKGCPLDLHERAFPPGRCAQTLLARLPVIVHRTSAGPAFELYVARSCTDYFWEWLQSAAHEFGTALPAA